jgi:hypothetical protein
MLGRCLRTIARPKLRLKWVEIEAPSMVGAGSRMTDLGAAREWGRFWRGWIHRPRCRVESSLDGLGGWLRKGGRFLFELDQSQCFERVDPREESMQDLDGTLMQEGE